MRNKLLVAGTLALAMTCTTVFSSITPAVVKAASVSTVQTQTAENSDDYVCLLYTSSNTTSVCTKEFHCRLACFVICSTINFIPVNAVENNAG